MKILIHSNGPQVPTGYGVQTALLAQRLHAAGHDVAVSCYFGLRSGMSRWNGITLYPEGYDAFGNDILPLHAMHHFEGDPKGGWIIPLMDLWALRNPQLRDFNVAGWCPVDHFPIPPEVGEFFTVTDSVPIAMSEYGRDQLSLVGFDPLYAPLSVDTRVFKPTPTIKHGDEVITGRELIGVGDDKFLVVMNGMNKGNAIHRKGFPFALRAFAQFAKRHPEAILYLHTEPTAMNAGIDLIHAATLSGVPSHQLMFPDSYAYRIGVPQESLAAIYTAADVLLAPSMGEGFCVPLIEAQACGTPVIVTDFAAQPELVGEGWKVTGQPYLDAAQGAWMIAPDENQIEAALEAAYEADREAMAAGCIDKAREYDADFVFDKFWVPLLAELEGGDPPELDRPPMPTNDAVAVLVPALNRPQNVDPLVRSFKATTNGVRAHLYFVCDADDTEQIAAVKKSGANLLISDHGSSFAQKINSGFEQTTEPWILAVGDDVKFHPGWLEAAAKLSDRFDVIGTNDTLEPGKGNPRVQFGVHADHFFVRRSYVDTYGGCLGKGVCHEGYRHFYADVETVELAKARRVFSPCLDSVVEHLHPDFGKAPVDGTYEAGWGEREHDEKEWSIRSPLIAMQKTGRAK